MALHGPGVAIELIRVGDLIQIRDLKSDEERMVPVANLAVLVAGYLLKQASKPEGMGVKDYGHKGNYTI